MISFLFSSGAIQASKKIAAPDLKVVLAHLIISIEMAFFAIFHLWSFPWKPYAAGFQTDEITDMYGNGKSTYQGGRWGLRALLDALNPIDLVRAIGRSMRWLFVGRKNRTLDPSYQPTNEAIRLNPTEAEVHPADTSYGGAGAVMTGGASSRYGKQQDEEGEVLLSHAQPNPSTTDMGTAPPPYDEDQDQYHFVNNRSDDHLGDSNLHPHSGSMSPFEEVHYPSGPSRSPSDSDSGSHHNTVEYPTNTSHFPTSSTELQEQPPIPLPDSYQPPHTRYDYDTQGRR